MLFSASGGVQIAEFDREAADFADAVASAIKAIEGAVKATMVTSVTRSRDLAATGQEIQGHLTGRAVKARTPEG